MELSLFIDKVTFQKIELIDTEHTELCIFPNRTGGRYNNFLNITIKNSVLAEDEDPYINVELNKNEVRYIIGMMNAFLSETDIDIDAED